MRVLHITQLFPGGILLYVFKRILGSIFGGVCLNPSLHHKSRLPSVILCLVICPAQNTKYFQEVYFCKCLGMFWESIYLGESIWTLASTKNLPVISYFVFAYVSCTKCNYFQIYFHMCLAGFLGSKIWRCLSGPHTIGVARMFDWGVPNHKQ